MEYQNRTEEDDKFRLEEHMQDFLDGEIEKLKKKDLWPPKHHNDEYISEEDVMIQET